MRNATAILLAALVIPLSALADEPQHLTPEQREAMRLPYNKIQELFLPPEQQIKGIFGLYEGNEALELCESAVLVKGLGAPNYENIRKHARFIARVAP